MFYWIFVVLPLAIVSAPARTLGQLGGEETAPEAHMIPLDDLDFSALDEDIPGFFKGWDFLDKPDFKSAKVSPSSSLSLPDLRDDTWKFLGLESLFTTPAPDESAKRPAQETAQPRKRPRTEEPIAQNQASVTQNLRILAHAEPTHASKMSGTAMNEKTAAEPGAHAVQTITLIPWEPCTVRAIYNEWKYGFRGQPALMELTKTVDWNNPQYGEELLSRLAIFLLANQLLKNTQALNPHFAALPISERESISCTVLEDQRRRQNLTLHDMARNAMEKIRHRFQYTQI
ncbi:MAG: hypothetical protein SGCHY_000727 [Lobulomycetales sp.]